MTTDQERAAALLDKLDEMLDLNGISAWKEETAELRALLTEPRPETVEELREAALQAAADVHGGYMDAQKKNGVLAAISVFQKGVRLPEIITADDFGSMLRGAGYKDVSELPRAIAKKFPHGVIVKDKP